MVQRRQLLVLREEALLVGTCRNTRDVRVLENEMRGVNGATSHDPLQIKRKAKNSQSMFRMCMFMQ